MSAWAPSLDRLDAPPPTLAQLLAGRPCAEWLRRRHDELAASPAIVDQAAAVGVVVRLWEPSKTDGAAILAGDAPDPAQCAAAWVARLGASSRDALGHVSKERAAALRGAFQELADRDGDRSGEEVLVVLYERDVLESVRVLLSFVGEGAAVAAALALTDDVAATTWSAIAPSEAFWTDPLLRAVFVAEPESVWGQFVEA